MDPARKQREADTANKGRNLLKDFRADVYIRFGHGVAEQLGRLLFEHFSGQRVRFPSYREFIREVEDRRIRNAFNGRNHNELARRFGRSEKTIRRIVNGK